MHNEELQYRKGWSHALVEVVEALKNGKTVEDIERWQYAVSLLANQYQDKESFPISCPPDDSVAQAIKDRFNASSFSQPVS